MLSVYESAELFSDDVMLKNIANLSLSPIPSFSGLVFAAVAASLPLLQSKNIKAAVAIMKLVETCSGYLLEATSREDENEDLTTDLINLQRLQHILHRFEQVIDIL